jgi:hypothetical protein
VFLSEEAPAGQLALKAMDHTHCFTCGRDLTKRVRRVDTIEDERVFGDFPAFRRFRDRHQVRQAANRLRTIDRDTVTRITQALPREWDVAKDVQEALVDLIVRRAVFVAESIESKLWPQRELPFGDPE